MRQQRETVWAIAKIIRGRSEDRQLIQAEEILAELRGQGLLDSEDDGAAIDLEAVVEQALHENEDLKEIRGRDGVPFYHSVQSLTETYAGILTWKSDNPLWLIAQVVRDNSRRYPRPVPVDSFQEPPFELAREEIAECLKGMSAKSEYQDIFQTTTSIGTPFLYSTRHLDPDHASMLAEWLDVGQANNP